MHKTKATFTRTARFNTALLTLGCVLSLTLIRTSFAASTVPAVLQPLDDKLPSLPLDASFDKVTDNTEGGPYILKLKNTSSDALNVRATIYPSVTIHSDTKQRELPERSLAAGEVWSIPGLAATDKVTVNAKGFAPLEITVP
jgi:hypothetical protein